MHARSFNKTVAFVALFVSSLCAVLVWGVLALEKKSTPSVSEPAVEDVFPDNFSLRFEYGVCAETASRNYLEINADGSVYRLYLTDDQQTGREAQRALTGVEQGRLLTLLEDEHVWDLPDVITAPEGVIPLDPGCSRLMVQSAQKQKSIDEADGINASYYTIKTYLMSL
ncbi:MAG TPA: hypothetical protein PKL83_05805 [bacterium]|nr:hypothetical protein [bacterium]